MKRAPYLVFFLAPFAWQILTSLWPEAELGRPLPSSFTLAAYRSVLHGPFSRAVVNCRARSPVASGYQGMKPRPSRVQ